MRKLIITADDFGFTNNINKGIIETVEAGSTTEVSLMVRSYGAQNAMRYAKDNDWQNVGIHLSIFDTERDEVPFRSKDYDMVLENWSREELLKRISTEIKTFEDFFGRKPSHINGHKQLHFHPKIIDFVLQYAIEHDVYVRKWGDFEADSVLPVDMGVVKAKFKSSKVKTSDYLFGFVYDFDIPENATVGYEELIQGTPDDSVIEILFHPGYCGEQEAKLTSFINERVVDKELLCSVQFKKMIAKYVD